MSSQSPGSHGNSSYLHHTHTEREFECTAVRARRASTSTRTHARCHSPWATPCSSSIPVGPDLVYVSIRCSRRPAGGVCPVHPCVRCGRRCARAPCVRARMGMGQAQTDRRGPTWTAFCKGSMQQQPPPTSGCVRKAVELVGAHTAQDAVQIGPVPHTRESNTRTRITSEAVTNGVYLEKYSLQPHGTPSSHSSTDVDRQISSFLVY